MAMFCKADVIVSPVSVRVVRWLCESLDEAANVVTASERSLMAARSSSSGLEPGIMK